MTVGCEEEARVSFTVFSEPGRLDPGTVTVRFSDDGRTRTVFLDERNPNETCIGCFGYRSFPVVEAYRTSPAESLWMTWGGNLISHPVVY